MKKQNLVIAGLVTVALMQFAAVVSAATPFPPAPIDLPPGAMSYGNADKGILPLDPNILAAVIGVVGLIIGSIISILATYVMRWMDVRREDKREDMLMERGRKEKEYQIKQENYRTFLNDLAQLETFHLKDMDSFKKEWTKLEIKIDLVASPRVSKAKDVVQAEMMGMAEKHYKGGQAELATNYVKNRDELLAAIREDIDILQES